MRHGATPMHVGNGWMPHCLCGWRDPSRIIDDRDIAVRLTVEHIHQARTREVCL